MRAVGDKFEDSRKELFVVYFEQWMHALACVHMAEKAEKNALRSSKKLMVKF